MNIEDVMSAACVGLLQQLSTHRGCAHDLSSVGLRSGTQNFINSWGFDCCVVI